jgi:hypothetical protein
MVPDGRKRAGEAGQRQAERGERGAHGRGQAGTGHQPERGAKRCAGRDAEKAGISQRVAEQRLERGARDGKRGTDGKCCQEAGEADVAHHHGSGWVGIEARNESGGHLGGRHGNGAQHEVEEDRERKTKSKRDARQGRPGQWLGALLRRWHG